MSLDKIIIIQLFLLPSIVLGSQDYQYNQHDSMMHETVDTNYDTTPSASELRLAQDELQQRNVRETRMLVRKKDGKIVTKISKKKLTFRQRMVIKFLAKIIIRMMDTLINQQTYLQKKVLPFTSLTVQELQIMRKYLKNMTPEQTQDAINSLVLDRKQYYLNPEILKLPFVAPNNAATQLMQKIDQDVAVMSNQEMFNTEMIIIKDVVSASLPATQKIDVSFDQQAHVPEFKVF